MAHKNEDIKEEFPQDRVACSSTTTESMSLLSFKFFSCAFLTFSNYEILLNKIHVMVFCCRYFECCE